MTTTPTHILLYRYRPGTGPQPGDPELEAEMAQWDALDVALRADRRLVWGYALHERGTLIGPGSAAVSSPLSTTEEVVFAVHAVALDDDQAAEDLAKAMPHLEYGSVEIRPIMG